MNFPFEEIEDMVNKFGFPLLVSIWFMFRADKQLRTVVKIQEKILHIIDKNKRG